LKAMKETQMPEDPNAGMRQKLAARIIGQTITGLDVQDHTVIIRVANAEVVLRFEDVVEFELHAGEWRFIPNRNPGRPRKGGA